MLWGWLSAAVVALLGTGTVWYYRNKLSTVDSVASLVKANSQVLTDLNSLLASMTVRAKAASMKDKTDAQAVKDAPGAAAFLNASVPPTAANLGATAGVRVTDNQRGSCVVLGFGRGPGHFVKRPGRNPGSVD